jgi:hypothetical protein
VSRKRFFPSRSICNHKGYSQRKHHISYEELSRRMSEKNDDDFFLDFLLLGRSMKFKNRFSFSLLFLFHVTLSLHLSFLFDQQLEHFF